MLFELNSVMAIHVFVAFCLVKLLLLLVLVAMADPGRFNAKIGAGGTGVLVILVRMAPMGKVMVGRKQWKLSL